MYFGSHNSLAYIPNYDEQLFKGLIDKGYVAIYMDNVLIFTQTIEHHQEVVSCVLNILQKYQLYLESQESAHSNVPRLSTSALSYLRGQVGNGSSQKTGVKEWPPPKSNQGSIFVGFINSTNASSQTSPCGNPLHQLTRRRALVLVQERGGFLL